MRTQPYTDIGLKRKLCCHCQKRKAQHQWSVKVCANNHRRVWVAVCTPCDIDFNSHTLHFINHPDADKLIAAYSP